MQWHASAAGTPSTGEKRHRECIAPAQSAAAIDDFQGRAAAAGAAAAAAAAADQSIDRS